MSAKRNPCGNGFNPISVMRICEAAPPKHRGLVKSVADLDYVVVGSESEALLTEGQLIKEYKPRYNVMYKDDKRFLLLKIDLAAPYPRFSTCRIQRDAGAEYFGPYTSSASARAAMDFVEKRYGLRKCTPRQPGEEDYKHCINDVVRFCSAPCVDRISKDEYRARCREAIAFLNGDRPEELDGLQKEMEEASAALQFEKAAVLRDTLMHLRKAVRQRTRISGTPELRKADALQGVQVLSEILQLPNPPHVIECFDISNISGTYSVASMVCAVDGQPNRSRYRRFRIRTVEGIDDPASIAEAVSRRYSRLKEEGGTFPDLLVLDGGITQLRAARAALAELGIEDLPSVGLAKREELIFWRDGEPPLELPAASPGLKVLQRLRDEAHRFALTYHRHLRRERIRESVLDDIPGVGERRKQELLRHFGSIRRLMAADEAGIAEVPGVGPELANAIRSALNELT